MGSQKSKTIGPQKHLSEVYFKFVFKQLVEYVVEAFDKSVWCDGEQDVIDIKDQPLTANIVHWIKGVILSLTKFLE